MINRSKIFESVVGVWTIWVREKLFRNSRKSSCSPLRVLLCFTDVSSHWMAKWFRSPPIMMGLFGFLPCEVVMVSIWCSKLIMVFRVAIQSVVGRRKQMWNFQFNFNSYDLTVRVGLNLRGGVMVLNKKHYTPIVSLVWTIFTIDPTTSFGW